MREHAREWGISSHPIVGAANLDSRLNECRAQAGLYRLLGRCLEEEIDAELLALLRGELRAALMDTGVTLDKAFLEAPAETLLEELAEDYTGLFVAPGGVSPYASVFETGRIFQPVCDRVLDAYREAGWDYERRFSGEFADHVGTMLSFVGLLSEAEGNALEQGDLVLADERCEQKQHFLLDNLGSWGPGWCRHAAGAALSSFYCQLLQLAEYALWSDLAAVATRRELKALAVLNKRAPVKLDYDADFRKASGL